MQNQEKIITIPNILSFYRLIMFPVILVFAILNEEKLFVIFFSINLITDILDGFIARKFNMQTKLGAKLDSVADIGSYILAFIGVFLFKWTDFEPHLISFSIFLILYLATEIFSLIKFRKFASLHLYSSKSGGYIQGFFFFTLFAYNFIPAFYYLMIISGYISFSEHLIVQIYLPEMRSNVKGIYWLIKENPKH